MEGRARDQTNRLTVEGVPDEGVAEMGEVNPDLVGASRLEDATDPRQITGRIASQDLDMGDGVLSGRIDHATPSWAPEAMDRGLDPVDVTLDLPRGRGQVMAVNAA